MSLRKEILQSVVKKLINGLDRIAEQEDVNGDNKKVAVQVKELTEEKTALGKDVSARPHRIMWPKCIYSEQEPCLSSEGFFTPCCWFDDEENKKQKWADTFFYEHLHIDNFDDIEDIFLSKEWSNFFQMLKENPSDAPPICNKMCGSELVTKKTLKVSSLGENRTVTMAIKH